MFKFFTFLFSRTIILFVAAFLLSHWLVDTERMKVKTINRVVPASMREMIEFSLSPKGKNPAVLKKYLLYFKTVAKILPRSAVAQAMVGYCHYYLGDVPKAQEFFNKAIKITPNFFWFHYDLGVIYFRQGLYPQAAQALEKAIACPPQETMVYLNMSKIYKGLDSEAAQLGYNTEKGLAEGYRNANEMLMLHRYHLSGSIKKDYWVQIF
ncbi:MAG: tetratricopeptide repeat protein [Candidatus Omnitrophica bacterium]|nr:tetratricopeptide repeat protein [Candidatus Omnitrophota bacterium]